MMLDVNYRIIGKFELTDLKKAINTIPENVWKRDDFLRKNAYLNQLDGIRFVRAGEWVHDDLKEIKELIAQIYDFCAKKFSGVVVHSYITRLPPNCSVPEHIDGRVDEKTSKVSVEGTNPRYIYAHHLQLIVETNPKVEMKIGGEILKVKDGDLIDYNNAQFHSVKNNSKDSRIMITMDVLDKKLLHVLNEEDKVSDKAKNRVWTEEIF